LEGGRGGGGGSRGFGVDELARRLGLDAGRLSACPVRYRAFEIPKRSGGLRRIDAPEDELKQVQIAILRRLLARLRVHPSAIGFERGHSIVSNATFHARQAVIIRMDLCEFFHSTRAARIESYFAAIGWNAEASRLLTRLVTHEGSLPQGAPTSPRLSNLVNCRMDARLSAAADRSRARYSRYADDLTFSLEADDGRAVQTLIRSAGLIAAAEGYRLHRRRKLHVRRRHQRQLVTGLVVNHVVQLPRETRRRLRAVEHRIRTGGEASLSPAQLAGWNALQHMIDAQRNPETR
jgi:retron-type reverse transcriptase